MSGGNGVSETIQVGDRVRLKGDHGRERPPLWMTVIREDMSKPDDAGNPSRRFVMVAFPSVTDGGGPALITQGGILPEALTKEPPATAKPAPKKPANRRK